MGGRRPKGSSDAKTSSKSGTYTGGAWDTRQALLKAALVWGVVVTLILLRQTITDTLNPLLPGSEHYCWTVAIFTWVFIMTGMSPFCLPLAYLLLMHKDYFVGFLGQDAQWASIIVVPTTATALYWFNGGIMLLLDAVWRPEVYTQFKIQKTKRFDMKKIGRVMKNIVIGQLLCFYGMGAVYHIIKVNTGYGCVLTSTAPSHKEMFLVFTVAIAIDEIMFFYVHWLFHTKALYPYHKIHHEFKSPIGLVAMYSHPLENLMANILPFSLGPILLGAHTYTFVLFTIFAVLGTQMHHSGYKFPWMTLDHQPEYHDFHHEQFNYNFGNIGLLDKYHGTEGGIKGGWVQREKYYRDKGVVIAPGGRNRDKIARPAAG